MACEFEFSKTVRADIGRLFNKGFDDGFRDVIDRKSPLREVYEENIYNLSFMSGFNTALWQFEEHKPARKWWQFWQQS